MAELVELTEGTTLEELEVADVVELELTAGPDVVELTEAAGEVTTAELEVLEVHEVATLEVLELVEPAEVLVLSEAIGPTGPTGPQGDPGPGAADTPWGDDTLALTNLSGPIDLGAGGAANIRWARTGRTIHAALEFTIGTGAALGSNLLAVAGTDLPAPPTVPVGRAHPGGYGFVSRAESSPGAGDGYRHAIIPFLVNFGGPVYLLFVVGSEAPAYAGGIAALWTPTNVVAAADLEGAQYLGSITYEAAAAAP